jgi:hypothetical protein
LKPVSKLFLGVVVWMGMSILGCGTVEEPSGAPAQEDTRVVGAFGNCAANCVTANSPNLQCCLYTPPPNTGSPYYACVGSSILCTSDHGCPSPYNNTYACANNGYCYPLSYSNCGPNP